LNHGAKSLAQGSLDNRQNVIEALADAAKACDVTARRLRGVQRVRIPWSLGPEMPESAESLTATLARMGITRSRPRKLILEEKLGDTHPAKYLPPLPAKFAAELTEDLKAVAAFFASVPRCYGALTSDHASSPKMPFLETGTHSLSNEQAVRFTLRGPHSLR